MPSEGASAAMRPVVARIPYLNAQPFYVDWGALPAASVDLVPRRLGEEARAGRVDAGLMAAADFFSLAGSFERVGALGIGCRGEVGSVLLLSRAPVSALSGARIRLTAESSTSAALVRILLERRFGLSGLSYARADLPAAAAVPEGEAWLVIGDAALAARRADPDRMALDLGREWTEWTDLPFVYAVWAVRKSLPAAARDDLGRFLESSLAMGERSIARTASDYARVTGGALGSESDLAGYLERFVYRLGPEEEKGLAAFRRMWTELGVVVSAPHATPAAEPATPVIYERSATPVSSLTLRWVERPPDPTIPRGAEPPTMRRVRAALEEGRRLTREEGLYLLREAPLVELGALAQRERLRRLPQPIVTYVVDSNPNYTNVCTVDCHFCAFYRKPGHAEAYTLSIEQVLDHVRRASELGCTTVLLQGGLNPQIPFSFYPDLVRAVRREFPDVTPHFFSAPEIQQMAEVSGLTVRGVLQALRDAGQTSLPGGGAEILSDRVRRRLGPKKGPVERWLEVHRAAHALGLRSTATMMYGHLDAPEDRLEHLDLVRSLQDEALAQAQPGFTAFVPWSYKRDGTALANKVPKNAGAALYLRVLAAARLYLDNVEHVQASWFSEGKRAGQVGLQFGADDFGGTLFEENVHKATGFVNRTSVEEVRTLIREAGFTPAQRNTHYDILRIDEAPAASVWVEAVAG